MKNRTFWGLLLIFVAAVLLRVWGLNSDGELWLDEITTYYGCLKSLFDVKQMAFSYDNPPFYHYILWFWIKLFGNSDWMMKFLSVIFSSLSVIVAYFCGKEAEGEKTGYIFAGLMAISAISIYYAQEVRPYALVTLLSTLVLLSILRLVRNFNYKNLGLLICSNILLVFTHTLAYLFCFFEFLVLFVYFYRNNRNNLKSIILSCLIVVIFSLSNFFELARVAGHSYQDTKNWADTAFTFINNYTSPHLININYGELNVRLSDMFESPERFLLIAIFSFLLVAIYIAAVAKSIKPHTFNRYLFAIWFLYITTLAFFAVIGKTGFMTRYTLIPLPFFIFLASSGLAFFKKKNLLILLTTIFVLNFVFMFSFPKISAQNIKKTLDLAYFNDLPKTLNRYEFNKGDIFIIFYYYSTYDYAGKYYDITPYRYYLFKDWNTNFLEERQTHLTNILNKIKQNNVFDKNLMIAIPSDHFGWYEEIIKTAQLETGYKKLIQHDENNWTVLIYSNSSSLNK